ncbi:tRNA synthetases class I-domain-containing protein [Myxozyma melibiosi]|uniref:isoleucine--tRNA ligase n=1 Tax=Myxozyma melibiosi TaxID=54550 RepID=A0ABR1F0A2_9ASCO
MSTKTCIPRLLQGRATGPRHARLPTSSSSSLRSATHCYTQQRRHESNSSAPSYTATILMPKTSFPARSNAKVAQEVYLKVASDDVYAWQKNTLPEESLFILHDGPPYANADVHLGHSVNRIIKDIILRYQILRGRRVSYIPGWDCHGLPIELKVLEKVGKGKDGKKKVAALTAPEIRALARKHADSFVESQMASFREWATMGEWENPYKTMNPDFEIRQLEIFKSMLNNGLIYRSDRPVYWSCESYTALAEAELEYASEHTSKTVYVKFPIENASEVLGSDLAGKKVEFLIWTTTPWTIPSNKAIAVGHGMTYIVVRSEQHGYLLIGESRKEFLETEIGPLEIVSGPFSGEQLTALTYTHPLLTTDTPSQPVFAAHFVTADSGTGLVHMAPGHGMDDYLVCQSHGIDPYSPVNSYGKFDSNLPPELSDLVGKPVLKVGQDMVIERLQTAGALAGTNPAYKHKYPYDWRSKKPVIIRSTPQWFANVGNIKDQALDALENANFHPAIGKHRLSSFVRDRSEWCISRQRVWGVPIPALFDNETGEALLTDESVTHIIKEIEKVGIDMWFTDEEDTTHWVAPQYRESGKSYSKGRDTMDVWFDSGSSWTLIQEKYGNLRKDRETLVDVYSEGSDQHRGWFQSSLLTYVADQHNGKAPYANVITHGFTLDEHGRKMSKSLGNVIAPAQITTSGYKNVAAIGSSGLRLWVAQSEYTTDIAFSTTVMQRVADSLSKIRRTMRYVLGNLDGFDGQEVEYSQLRPTDQYALCQLYDLEQDCKAAYDQFAFNRVIQAVMRHVSRLSASYLDTSKDRIYVDEKTSLSRRSVQTVLCQIFRVYESILSPVIPLLTQEAWHHAPAFIKKNDPDACFSPFVSGWVSAPEEWKNEELRLEFAKLEKIGDAAKIVLARAREDKKIGSSLDACVVVSAPEGSSVLELLKKYESHLAELLVVSAVSVSPSSELASSISSKHWTYASDPVTTGEDTEAESVIVHAVNPELGKCARCWQYTAPAESEICPRCAGVVEKIGEVSL